MLELVAVGKSSASATRAGAPDSVYPGICDRLSVYVKVRETTRGPIEISQVGCDTCARSTFSTTEAAAGSAREATGASDAGAGAEAAPPSSRMELIQAGAPRCTF